ncbi:hypothetical protein PGT21_008193 [Puccinia graminis f. sp. tritici]|uniref:Uncharacterized protein n=1 Tax=Puccinia graminis f. sp. tritici TaxID=56615 RepID=A0A5B0PHN0_PUCGR|nr:hypothetical protein PGT21_008193 [Puccinia graminis f. sp. tritici]
MSSTRKRPKASRISSASSTYPTENLTETNPSNPNESAATDAEEDLTTPASTQHQTDMSHEASDIQDDLPFQKEPAELQRMPSVVAISRISYPSSRTNETSMEEG